MQTRIEKESLATRLLRPLPPRALASTHIVATNGERTNETTSDVFYDPNTRLTIRAVFFGLFVVLNDKLRGWYAVLDGIPGAGPPGSLEHVETFHALCATLIFATPRR